MSLGYIKADFAKKRKKNKGKKTEKVTQERKIIWAFGFKNTQDLAYNDTSPECGAKDTDHVLASSPNSYSDVGGRASHRSKGNLAGWVMELIHQSLGSHDLLSVLHLLLIECYLFVFKEIQ